MKEFSVLISVYAREQSDYLRSALHSVFEQTVPPTEVVLVEDGPLTTELEAVITDFCEKYNTLKIVKLAKNMGLGNALNIGLSACTYDLVADKTSHNVSDVTSFLSYLYNRYKALHTKLPRDESDIKSGNADHVPLFGQYKIYVPDGGL